QFMPMPHTLRRPEPNAIIGNSSFHLGPQDLATIYDINPMYAGGFNGAGQSVAIVTAFPYTTQDVRDYESQFGLPQTTLNNFNIGKVGGKAGDETTLDVEMASSMARGGTINVVIGANAQFTTFDQIYTFVANNLTSTHSVTTSWGLCETSTPQASLNSEHNSVAAGTAAGQT